MTFRYLSIGEKCIFIKISVAGATASEVPEIIISTKQFCKNSSTKNELKIKSVFKGWERRVVPH